MRAIAWPLTRDEAALLLEATVRNPLIVNVLLGMLLR